LLLSLYSGFPPFASVTVAALEEKPVPEMVKVGVQVTLAAGSAAVFTVLPPEMRGVPAA